MSDQTGDLTPELVSTHTWTDDMVISAGIPINDVPFVSVGGGLGSFALVDYLRVAGVSPDSIRVLAANDEPWQTYQYLAVNSQIPPHERLRSDSASVLDNVWGFPSYAFREAATDKSLGPVWQVSTEPILSEYFTPRAGQVYDSVRRECDRIGWWSMVSKGQVRMVRRRHGGGYYVILTPPTGSTPTKRFAFRCRFVHVAVGYPGVRFLDDLQEYREKHGDYARVVNAYEPHNHVYKELLSGPKSVVVRGSGIVSSRVLQRLLDDWEQNGAQTTVWHLFRTYVAGPQGDSVFSRRPGGDGFAYQAFNYPKAAWGGTLREKLFRLEGDAKREFLRTTGGTNTAPRRKWRRQLDRAAQAGRYRQTVGTVEEVVPGDSGTIVTRIRAGDGTLHELPAHFIIDATGLEADIREHRLLADLLDHCGAGTNVVGRLDTDRAFAVVGADSAPGRLYASGSITLGSTYAPVDSFLGLQYSALQIADDLARQGFGRRIGPARSISQWFKWMRNARI